MPVNDARVISVLVVDDVDISVPNRRDLYAAHHARSLEDVQEILTQGNRGEQFDCFLVDVNLAMLDEPDGLDWGERSGGERADIGKVRPYGPLLVLPFLDGASMPFAFVSYSAVWSDDAVTRNGYLVVAMSLVYARNFGNQFSLGQVAELMGRPRNQIGTWRAALW